MWGDSEVPNGPSVGAGAGNDTLLGGSGGERLYGQEGNDVIEGEAGGDYLYLELGNDQVRGGDGSDSFDNPSYSSAPADGADLISGGRGSDTLDLSDRPHNLSVTLNNTADDGAAGEFDNIMADIEYTYLGAGNDVFNADTAQANAAEMVNSVDGRAGNDTINTGEGDDRMYGGPGSDTLGGQAGNDDLRGDDDNDTLSGGDGDDYVTAGVGSDVIKGDAGDDQLYQQGSADGSDSISGGTGVDSADFSGRTTNMRITQDNVDPDGAGPLKGNDGADADLNNVAEEGDDVRADVENLSTGSGNDLISAGFAAANALGLDNTFRGYLGNDVIHGGNGEDTLYGSTGDDNLTGGAGGDALYGESGADVLSALDGYFDYLDGGSDNDTQTSDAFDQKINFP